MRTFAVVHNIPSPYRLHLFRVLNRVLRARGLELVVHFMSHGHTERRHWDSAIVDLGFQHVFWRDLGVRLWAKERHANPGLIEEIWRNRPEFLVVGGPWASLTGVAAAMLARRSVSVAWFEGNARTVATTEDLRSKAKRLLLKRYGLIAVPGIEGERLARRLLGEGAGPSVVRLPNIVDESRFRIESGADAEWRRSAGVREGERLAIWPARATWEKGILEFLGAIEARDLEGWRVALIGEGPLAKQVDARIKDRGLSERVQRTASVRYERMPAFYRSADLFMLPSVRDQNPLSVVEAMHAGLPLLVSDRIGNFPEALREGENGWSVDPGQPERLRAVLQRALSTPNEELRRMGQRSRDLAAQHWTSEAAVSEFVDRVLEAG